MVREAVACSECGEESWRLIKGLCPRCYSRQRYQGRKTEGKAIMAERSSDIAHDIAEVITPDTMIDCEPYKGRWTARACIGFQLQAKEAVSSLDPMNPLIAKRHACLDCAKGKVIAAILKDQDFSVKLPPKRTNGGRGPEILVRENGQLPKGFRTPKAAKKSSRELQNTDEKQEGDKNMAEVSNNPGPVAYCVRCKEKPEVNPVTHLCRECHSEYVKSNRPKARETIEENLRKNFGMDKWVSIAFAPWPRLIAAIEERAQSELRSAEAQCAWMLMQACGLESAAEAAVVADVSNEP